MRRFPFSGGISLVRLEESDDDMSAETDVDAKHLTALFSARIWWRVASIKWTHAENEFWKLETQELSKWKKEWN